MDWDFYDTLKISKMSFSTDIKRAYKRCVAGYNPNSAYIDNAIQDQFRKATIAYYVLSNPEFRKTYDIGGYDGLRNDGIYVLTLDCMKIYNTIFQPIIQSIDIQPVDEFETSNIINIDTTIPLKTVYIGEYRDIHIGRKSICDKCKGTGSDDCIMRACKKCQGRRVLPYIVNEKTIVKKCELCNGIGVNLRNKCTKCDGTRTMLEDYCTTITIPVGVSDGEKIVVAKQGNIVFGNNARDDIIITVNYETNLIYQTKKKCVREINEMHELDLYCVKSITLATSLCRKAINIELLNGDNKEIRLDNIIKPNDIISIENAGLPLRNNPNKCGKLYIVFQIIYPTRIPDDKIDLLYDILSNA